MHIELVAEYEYFYCRIISEFASLPKEAKLSFISLQSAVSFHLGKTIEKLKLKNRLIDIPVYMIFNTWIGLIHYYLQNREYFSAGSSVLKKYKDELIDSFIKMITKNNKNKK